MSKALQWARNQMPRKSNGDPDPVAKSILVLLCDHWNEKEGRCWPSQATLSKLSGYGETAVSSSLKRLEAAGYIRREKRVHATGPRKGQRTNDDIYINLTRPPEDVSRNISQPAVLARSRAASAETTRPQSAQGEPLAGTVQDRIADPVPAGDGLGVDAYDTGSALGGTRSLTAVQAGAVRSSEVPHPASARTPYQRVADPDDPATWTWQERVAGRPCLGDRDTDWARAYEENMGEAVDRWLQMEAEDAVDREYLPAEAFDEFPYREEGDWIYIARAVREGRRRSGPQSDGKWHGRPVEPLREANWGEGLPSTYTGVTKPAGGVTGLSDRESQSLSESVRRPLSARTLRAVAVAGWCRFHIPELRTVRAAQPSLAPDLDARSRSAIPAPGVQARVDNSNLGSDSGTECCRVRVDHSRGPLDDADELEP